MNDTNKFSSNNLLDIANPAKIKDKNDDFEIKSIKSMKSIKSNSSVKTNKTLGSNKSLSSKIDHMPDFNINKENKEKEKEKTKEVKLTPEQRKTLAWNRLNTYKQNGIQLTKQFIYATSSVEELEEELSLHQKAGNTDLMTTMFFYGIVASSYAVEKGYNSITETTDMDGFGNQTQIDRSKYIVIIDEILEKYNFHKALSPEAKLMMTFGQSAFMYGMSKRMSSKLSNIVGDEMANTALNFVKENANQFMSFMKDKNQAPINQEQMKKDLQQSKTQKQENKTVLSDPTEDDAKSVSMTDFTPKTKNPELQPTPTVNLPTKKIPPKKRGRKSTKIKT